MWTCTVVLRGGREEKDGGGREGGREGGGGEGGRKEGREGGRVGGREGYFTNLQLEKKLFPGQQNLRRIYFSTVTSVDKRLSGIFLEHLTSFLGNFSPPSNLCIDRQTDRQTDRQIERQVDRPLCLNERCQR